MIFELFKKLPECEGCEGWSNSKNKMKDKGRCLASCQARKLYRMRLEEENETIDEEKKKNVPKAKGGQDVKYRTAH